jgi:exodeoxyribonuclease VII large subunit
MDLSFNSSESLSDVDNEQGVSVSEFTRQVKDLLEESFLQIRVFGEISNLKRQSSGHIYFSLKDTESQVAAVLFRGDAIRNKLELRDGMQVLLEGSVSVYLPRGSYQIIARRVRELGKGSLREQFERLKKKLMEEGLFDASGKQELPLLPQRIGIITSPTGAVIRDFVSILQRLHWNGTVVVFPSRVQGKEALPELIQSIREANRAEYGLDLLVMARGGGSLEDLWNFNEESLVREIAASRLPIISAIGHETDVTLADFAADFRAETPSAAAERIASGVIEYRQKLDQLIRQLRREMRLSLERRYQQTESIQRRLQQVSPVRQLSLWRERLQRMGERLDSCVALRLQRERDRISVLKQRCQRVSPLRVVQQKREQLILKRLQWERLGQQRIERLIERTEVLSRRLKQVGPDVTLKRGFAMLEGSEGRVITDASAVQPGDIVKVRMRDGRIEVKVLSSDQ